MKATPLMAVAGAAAVLFAATSSGQAQQFEVPSNRQASQILPTQLIAGPHYRVRDQVVSYGYMHHYTVDSQFGVFQVTGDGALRKLIREIYASAALRDVKSTDAFVQAVGEAAKAPFSFAKNLITNPTETISGLPRGVFQIFGNAAESITMEHDPSEDSQNADQLDAKLLDPAARKQAVGVAANELLRGEQTDGERAPDDAHQREEGATLLGPQAAQ